MPAHDRLSSRTPSSSRRPRHVVCLKNDGLEVSLTVGKVYRVRRDVRAESAGFVRVVDDTDEDYLFPSQIFEAIELSPRAARALRAAS